MTGLDLVEGGYRIHLAQGRDDLDAAARLRYEVFNLEVGRACVAQAFRSRRVLLLLWKGLAAYLHAHDKRYLFGCCSLPTLDPAAGWAVAEHLNSIGAWHPMWRAAAADGRAVPASVPFADSTPELPMLFRTYLRFGAYVCGGPVLDRAFGTTDFLVILDRHNLTPEATAMFFTTGVA